MARRLGPIDIGGEPDPIARPNHDVALDPHRRGRAVHPLALPCPRAAFPLNPRAVPQVARARSSAGEHYADIVGVTGSIPVAPTILINTSWTGSLPLHSVRKHIGSIERKTRCPGHRLLGLRGFGPFRPDDEGRERPGSSCPGG